MQKIRLKRWGSDKLVTKNISPYRVKWNGKSPSKPQLLVKKFLHDYWVNDIVCEEFTIPGCRLRCDFINFTRNKAVEVHGGQHENFNKFFHKTRAGFAQHIKRDIGKIDWLEDNDFEVIEIHDHEIDKLDFDFILEKTGVELY